jgi:hypothetical protein
LIALPADFRFTVVFATSHYAYAVLKEVRVLVGGGEEHVA